MLGWRALAKSWKPSSGAQAPKIDDFNKGFNKKLIGLRDLAKSWKSSLKLGDPKLMILIRDLMRT